MYQTDLHHIILCYIIPCLADLQPLVPGVVQQALGEVPVLGLVADNSNGVDTNGAAAKVIFFDRWGKKVRPGTLGKIKVG